jgi:large-conductance mechanosensitive channel
MKEVIPSGRVSAEFKNGSLYVTTQAQNTRFYMGERKMASGKCYHHSSQDAVSQCRGCGKGICKDCYDIYGVTSEEYAGKALCFDCTSQLVESNVAEVGKLKAQTKKELIFIGIGMIIGVILGAMSGSAGAAILLGLIGGGGIEIIKALGRMLRMGSNLASGSYAGFIDGIIGFFTIFIAPVKTIIKIINRLRQVKQSDEIIVSDSQALQEMRDYFAYTQAIEKIKMLT